LAFAGGLREEVSHAPKYAPAMAGTGARFRMIARREADDGGREARTQGAPPTSRYIWGATEDAAWRRTAPHRDMAARCVRSSVALRRRHAHRVSWKLTEPRQETRDRGELVTVEALREELVDLRKVRRRRFLHLG